MKRYLVTAAVLVSMTVMPSATSAAPPVPQSPVDPAITSGKAAMDLASARERWQQSATTRYRFNIKASCFCAFLDPVVVKVNGRIKKVSNPDWFGPRSVPQLFKFVHEAIKRDAAVLNVKYAADGHVKSVAVDYSFNIADEEMAFTVSKFINLSGAIR